MVRTSVAVDVYNGAVDGEVAAVLTAASGGTNTSGAKVLVTEEEEKVLHCVDMGGGKSQVAISTDQTPTLATTHGGEPVVSVTERERERE